MSVINRIEICNFLNLDNRRPSEQEWRPHWRYVVLNLRGLSSAIVATNGLGKSTANKALYAILSRDRKFVSETRERAAPKRRGLWSHVRLEVLYQSSSDIIQPGLIGDEVRGDAYVLGLYGYSDEELRFYIYRGYLGDCPVVHADGHRKQMVPNAEFQATLKERPGLTHNPPTTDWKRQVHRHFDPSLIHQLLLYQKAGGGDGAENFFKVSRGHGEDYDSAFFFAHIAPEVLVNCMDVYGEEGEYRFEDTLLESARPVLEAQRKAEERAKTVQAAREVFDGLQAAKNKSDDYVATQHNLVQTVATSLAETAFLREIVETRPIPGIPQPLRGQSSATAFLADRMVCTNGEWLIPDKVIAEILASEAKTINREAGERQLQSISLKAGQVLEKPGHLGSIARTQGGGATNSGYGLEAALALIENRRNFAENWNADSAMRAINYAFEWHEKSGEPNPLRKATKDLKLAQEQLKLRIKENRICKQDFQDEQTQLQDRLQNIQVTEYALSTMRQSGLFTAEELAMPASTELLVEEQSLEARKAREAHTLRHTELNEFRIAYQAVSNEFPGRQPSTAQDELVAGLKETATEFETANSSLIVENQLFDEAETALQQAHHALEDVETVDSRITLLLPNVRKFEAVFPGQSPAGLQEAVQHDLSSAERRQATLQVELLKIEVEYSVLDQLLPDVARYRTRFGNEDPRSLAEKVVRDLAEGQAYEDRVERELSDARSNLTILEVEQAALVATYERFGPTADVSNLERTLADEVAARTSEKATIEGRISTLIPLVEALAAFEARFGDDRDALIVLEERAQRLPQCGRQRDELTARLSELQLQREELEAARAAAGRISREVLTCVGDTLPRLHQIVDELDVSTERRAQLLTHFSHVLHNPVVADPDAARVALEALDAAEIEAPVFLREELERFCRDGLLTIEHDLVYSFMVGAPTLQVRSLINPKEIAQLKARLNTKIEFLAPQVDALEQEYADLSPESDTSAIVRLAGEATEQKARAGLSEAQERNSILEDRLRELSEHRSEVILRQVRAASEFLNAGGEEELARTQAWVNDLARKLEQLTKYMRTLEERASPESMGWIRSINRFMDDGGNARHAELKELITEWCTEVEHLEKRLPTLRQRASRLPLIQAAEDYASLGGWERAACIAEEIDRARSSLALRETALATAKNSREIAGSRVSNASRKHTDAQLLLANWKDKLAKALKYVAEDGPAFDSEYEHRLGQLLDDQKQAHLRTRFEFQLAQQAVDAARDPIGRARLLERRDYLTHEINQLERVISEDDDLYEQESSRLKELQRSADNVDRAMIEILKQWRMVRDLMQAIPPELVSTATGESPYLQSARALLEDLQECVESGDLNELPNLLEGIASDISNFPLNDHRSQLDALKRQMTVLFNDLKRELARIRDHHGGQLTPGETEALSVEREPLRVVDDVNRLYLHFERFLLDAERLHGKSEEDVAEARQRLITSIAGFTDSLEENFRLLKSVLDRRDTGGAAGLRIAGELIDRSAVRDEIDAVIREVDREQRRRDEDKAADRVKESDTEFEERLKQQIRGTFYRTVFRAPKDSGASGPTVTFQHPQIAGGRPERLTASLSTGQGNALALLVLTKLADFTLHRDALADASNMDTRRRIKPSTTRVVIIDGLFSNLSNKKMIRHSLSVIRTLKGSFQLIGWIHNEIYENDPNLFPSYIALRRVGGSHGFVRRHHMTTISMRVK
jgi:hypothetical protein